MTDFELIVSHILVPMELEIVCDELSCHGIDENNSTWCERNCGKTNGGYYPEMNCYKKWLDMKREQEKN